MQDPLHVEVVDVLRTEVGRHAVVPEGHAARGPVEAHAVLGPGEVVEEQVEQTPALLRPEPDDAGREARVHEQRPFPGGRVHPHDGVTGHEALVADYRVGGAPLAGQGGAVAVLRAQPVEEAAEGLGQPLVGGHEVGEGRVAAELGHDVGPQHRCRGWVHRRGHIRVPVVGVGEPASQALGRLALDAVLGREALGRDRVDLGIAVRRVVVVGVGVGEVAELAGEGDLRGVVEVLVPEEHDLPAVEGFAHQGLVLDGQRSGEVEALDQRTGVTREGTDRGAHGRGHHRGPDVVEVGHAATPATVAASTSMSRPERTS